MQMSISSISKHPDSDLPQTSNKMPYNYLFKSKHKPNLKNKKLKGFENR